MNRAAHGATQPQEPKPSVRDARPHARKAPPPAAGRQRAMEAKTSKVLDAALELFSAYGFHGTRIEQVAERADISKANLLYHFSSKRALYEAVLRKILDIWLEPLKSFDTRLDPLVAIEAYVRAKLLYSRDHPLASRLFCLEVVQGADLLGDLLNNELRALVDSKAEVIRTWTAEGRLAAIEPHHLLFSIWAITQHYADFAVQVQALTGKSLSDPAFLEETIRNIRALILDGIRPR
jgi:TetR/AcrR family transcriptional regulator